MASPMIETILLKDQAILHVLINYLESKDLRRLRLTCKEMERLLITNSKFIKKALWLPLMFKSAHKTLLTNIRFRRNTYWKDNIAEGTQIKTVFSLLDFHQGEGLALTAYTLTLLTDNEEKYYYIKRRINDMQLYQDRMATVMHLNGYRHHDKLLTSVNQTSAYIQKTILTLLRIEENEKAKNDLGNYVDYHGEEKPLTVIDLLLALEHKMDISRAYLDNIKTIDETTSWNYPKKPSYYRCIITYSNIYLNNLLQETLTSLQNTTTKYTPLNSKHVEDSKKIMEDLQYEISILKFQNVIEKPKQCNITQIPKEHAIKNIKHQW